MHATVQGHIRGGACSSDECNSAYADILADAHCTEISLQANTVAYGYRKSIHSKFRLTYV